MRVVEPGEESDPQSLEIPLEILRRARPLPRHPARRKVGIARFGAERERPPIPGRWSGRGRHVDQAPPAAQAEGEVPPEAPLEERRRIPASAGLPGEQTVVHGDEIGHLEPPVLHRMEEPLRRRQKVAVDQVPRGRGPQAPEAFSVHPTPRPEERRPGVWRAREPSRVEDLRQVRGLRQHDLPAARELAPPGPQPALPLPPVHQEGDAGLGELRAQPLQRAGERLPHRLRIPPGPDEEVDVPAGTDGGGPAKEAHRHLDASTQWVWKDGLL